MSNRQPPLLRHTCCSDTRAAQTHVFLCSDTIESKRWRHNQQSHETHLEHMTRAAVGQRSKSARGRHNCTRSCAEAQHDTRNAWKSMTARSSRHLFLQAFALTHSRMHRQATSTSVQVKQSTAHAHARLVALQKHKWSQCTVKAKVCTRHTDPDLLMQRQRRTASLH